jgi:hypothetical protein
MNRSMMSLPGGDTASAQALILAGGDGRRLRTLTRHIAGDERPKQFCRVLDHIPVEQPTTLRLVINLKPRRRSGSRRRCFGGRIR